jgi:ABC-type polysaccharide/polyol phosphate export permease
MLQRTALFASFSCKVIIIIIIIIIIKRTTSVTSMFVLTLLEQLSLFLVIFFHSFCQFIWARVRVS